MPMLNMFQLVKQTTFFSVCATGPVKSVMRDHLVSCNGFTLNALNAYIGLEFDV